MAPKRERDEESEPVVDRRGAGVEEMTAVSVANVHAVIEEMQTKIAEHVAEVAKKNQEVEAKNAEMETMRQRLEAKEQEGMFYSLFSTQLPSSYFSILSFLFSLFLPPLPSTISAGVVCVECW
jgi:predicted nuclease with TOPRIM domain